MRRKTRHGGFFTRRWRQVTMIFILGLLFVPALAQAVTVTVKGSDGATITDYRWVAERDDTFHVDPAAANPVTQAIEFHKSYMPVAAEGTSADLTPLANLDPTKHYYISILPNGGYTLGGGPVKPGQTALEVMVHPNTSPSAIPTAQLSVFVFLDNNPINNNPELPAEQGLAGFKIILEEPAGRYGASGGQVLYDAFGNPLGTTYNPDGSVLALGNGSIVTDADGYAIIKNLPPAKYGVIIFPPEGSGTWYKTTTIEGTQVIDAWVGAGGPSTLVEFGIPTTHIFAGYVQPFNNIPGGGGATVTGTAVVNHMARPPQFNIFPGHDFPDVLVALNENGGGGLYVANGSVTGQFSIPNVPPGSYQLVLWDTNLDMIITFSIFDVPDPAPAVIALGDIVVNDWFAHLQGTVFRDDNLNGFMDPGEPGIQEQAVNIRWRDGTVYDSTGTAPDGSYTFDEIFPFFDWLVAEVDFARFRATGATVVVDAGGGPVNKANPDFPIFGRVVPQQQDPNDPFNEAQALDYRTETGEVLLEAFQAFAGLTNVINWGKVPYGPGENGGISGIVFYDVTRAENDPRFGFGETWQPGIARVQVNLYRDANGDGVIDNINGQPGVQLADVDNHPFGWSEGGAKGAEDIDRNGNGIFEFGDAIEVAWTDSWDDNLPTGCPGIPQTLSILTRNATTASGITTR